MTLRSINNPNIDKELISAIATIIVPNTLLAENSADGTGVAQIYQQTQGLMFKNDVFPAVLLYSGEQKYKLESQNTFSGWIEIHCDYYERYDKQTVSIDTARATMADDLERMKANMEDNRTLKISSNSHTTRLVSIVLSPYAGEIRNANTDQQTGILAGYRGIYYIFRRMTLHYSLLEYDVAA
jgi:hypothetical protein